MHKDNSTKKIRGHPECYVSNGISRTYMKYTRMKPVW